MFPLTRKVMLTGEFDEPEKRYSATREIVAGMNSLVTDRAMTQVYSYDDGFFYVKGDVVHPGKNLHRDRDLDRRERVKLRVPTRKPAA